MTSASYRFADMAKEKASQWKFRPAVRNDKISEATIEYILFFDPEKATDIAGPLYYD
jgi:heme oxygenase